MKVFEDRISVCAFVWMLAICIIPAIAWGCGENGKEAQNHVENNGSEAPKETEWLHWLPTDEISVERVDVELPPRLVELTNKLKLAMEQNPDWAMEHVKKAQLGKPLPYDPRLGLTKEEYDEFLSLADIKERKVVGSGTLVVKPLSANLYQLDTRGTIPDLDGITIDLDKNVVTTPHAVCSDYSQPRVTKGGIFGPWKGHAWKFEEVDPDKLTGTVVRFTLGKTDDSSEIFILYRTKKLPEEGEPVQINVSLTYPFPLKSKN